MEKLDQNPIQYVIKHVIMADAGVLDSTEKMKKTEILREHRIWKNEKEGYWYGSIPDKTKKTGWKNVKRKKREDIEKVKDLTIMAEGDAGVYIVANLKDNEFFITGHAEYDPYSLKSEYDRDIKAGMDMHIPINYYPDDDPTKEPIVRWRSVANLLFNNWLNYYVYQETPYDIDTLKQNPRRK